MKFIADGTLGTLAKWLRILGYDTLFYESPADRFLLTEARRKGRAVLSRKRDMAGRQFLGDMLILKSDRLENQLKEVMDRFHIRPEPGNLFSRCIQCNERLIGIEKEGVKGTVPPYTFETQENFMTCPGCRRIFWPGTHRERAEQWLMLRILRGRP